MQTLQDRRYLPTPTFVGLVMHAQMHTLRHRQGRMSRFPDVLRHVRKRQIQVDVLYNDYTSSDRVVIAGKNYGPSPIEGSDGPRVFAARTVI